MADKTLNGHSHGALNPHLQTLEQDVLYHLGLDTKNYDLPAQFGDVKFVCMGGTKYRMREFAVHTAEVLGISIVGKPINLTKHSHRYAMFKVGPVLSVSHGIGIPSMTILLQEVIKLLNYAKVEDPVFFRIGTSGGINVPPGSVIISSWAMNGVLEKSYHLPVLGKIRKMPAFFDSKLCEELLKFSKSAGDDFETIIGGTFAADDFYQGQARLDGPFCDYTTEEKMTFLHHVSSLGVVNMEMEATALAALTSLAGIRAVDVCVTLLDRAKGDQVTTSKSVLLEWQKRPMVVVSRYIAAQVKQKIKYKL